MPPAEVGSVGSLWLSELSRKIAHRGHLNSFHRVYIMKANSLTVNAFPWAKRNKV